MTKKIIIMILVLTIGLNVFAKENKKHSISLGYSSPSTYDVIQLLAFDFVNSALNHAAGAKMLTIGPINLSYLYNLTKNWSLGIMGSYRFNRAVTSSYTEFSHYITATAMVQFQYKVVGPLNFYHALQGGIYYITGNTRDPLPLPAFHITLLGLTLGNDFIRFFADTGVGVYGFVNAGVRFSL